MIVAIVTFQMPQPTTAEQMTAAFQAAVPMFESVAGLLTKYFYVSEDGRRAGGVYVWASRADATLAPVSTEPGVTPSAATAAGTREDAASTRARTGRWRRKIMIGSCQVS